EKLDGDSVKVNEAFVSWDPSHVPIIIEVDGIVQLQDLVEGVTIQKQKRGSSDQGFRAARSKGR
ncbi:MAG: hypothetical protein IKJ94_04350, partial [Oscillospiraceae bacterium]|nr:hypothetical protein [Oscillospiraceae bacterium]